MYPKANVPFFANVSWFTGAVVRSSDPSLCYPPHVQGLIGLIDAFEARLYCGNTLAYETVVKSNEPFDEIARRKEFAAVQITQIATALFKYRMLDIICLIEGLETPSDHYITTRSVPHIQNEEWLGFKADWRQVVLEGCRLLLCLGLEKQGPSHHPALDLFHRALTTADHAGAGAMKVNIALAVIHLRMLLRGQEFPDNLGKLSELLECDVKRLQAFVGTSESGTARLRLPLDFAVAVSPGILFSPSRIHRATHVNRGFLIQAWQSQSSARPTPLCRIERLIWKFIIHMALDDAPGDSEDSGWIKDIQSILTDADEDSIQATWFDSRQTHDPAPEYRHHGEDGDQNTDDAAQAAPVEASGVATPVSDGMDTNSPSGKGPAQGGVGGDSGSDREGEGPRDRMDVDDVPASANPDDPSSSPHGIGPELPTDIGRRIPVASGPADRQRRQKRARSSENVDSKRGASSSTHYGSLTSQVAGGNIFEVIDLTSIQWDDKDPTLATTSTAKARKTAAACRLYGPRGEQIIFEPSFHYDSDLNAFLNVYKMVESKYLGGLPLHVAQPESSMICVMQAGEFNSCSTREIQQIHAKKNIVVTGLPAAEHEFDLVGLQALTGKAANRVFTVQDLSICADDGNQNNRLYQGTIQHLVDAHQSPTGKTLNALDLPLPLSASTPPLRIASDVFASITNGSASGTMRLDAEDFPRSSTRWSLAATKGALTRFHIDTDGFGTFVECVSKGGSKWWVLACSAESSDATNLLDFERLFDFYNGDEMQAEHLRTMHLEAVLLQEGSRLYMKPFTNHAVLTPASAVCHGGHFLSTSNIRQTCLGFLTTFAMSTLLTNTQLTSGSLRSLRCLLEYWCGSIMGDMGGDDDEVPLHVPDIREFDGIHDVFSLLNIIELSDVVHPQTYEQFSLSYNERVAMVDARRLSRQLVEWILAHYSFESSEVSIRRFYWGYLAAQARAICAAKHFAEGKHTWSYTRRPIAARVENLIRRHFDGIPEFWVEWDSWDGKNLTTFAWSSPQKCAVKMQNSVSEVDMGWRADGRTEDDEAYFLGASPPLSPRKKRSRNN